MKNIWTSAFLAAACMAASAFATPQKQAELTVAGYNGLEALENFPVLVRVSESNISGFLYSDCAADGADIAFEDANGNVLSREIDTWDTTGESLVWVRLPTMTTNTVFTMTWGDSSVTLQPTSQTDGSVWRPAGYVGVWHFAGTGTDSAYSMGVTKTYGSPSFAGNPSYPSPVGSALWVDGASSAGYAAGGPWAVLGAGSSLSLSCWARANTSTPNCGRMISSKASWSQSAGYELTTQNSVTIITVGAADSKQMQTTISTGINTDWLHLAGTYSGTTTRFYLNGEQKGSNSSMTTLVTPTDQLCLGSAATAVPAASECWNGGIDEVRIRATTSSAKWLAAEYATQASPSFLTYGDAEKTASSSMLRIIGSPTEIGSPSPAYGAVDGLEAGDPVSLSMSVTTVAGAGTVTNHLIGWTLEAVDLDTDARTLIASSSDPGATFNAYSYTHASYAEFTWLWEVRDALGVGSPALVANEGDSLTLSATVSGIGHTASSASVKFAYGASPDALTSTGSVATVTGPGMVTGTLAGLSEGEYVYVKALVEADGEVAESAMSCFAAGTPGIYYVATTGDDTNGTGSPLQPFATIAKALGLVRTDGEIRVAGGLYTEALTSTRSAITISGSWLPGFAARDLRNGRTVIKAPSSSQDCFTISGSTTTSNTLSGLTLTGGRYGVRPDGSSNRDATTFNTICQCVISNCTSAIYPDSNRDGLDVLSSLIADNSDCGLYFNSDTGGKVRFLNCTFANNGEAALRRQHRYNSPSELRNCILVDNKRGLYYSNYYSSENDNISVAHTLWFGNERDIQQDSAANRSEETAGEPFAFDAVQLHCDPKLDASFAPQAGSPCIGAGLDFSADSRSPFDEDLYGDKWTDAWGLGCVKGSASATKHAELFVSAEGGDDANAGTSAAAPKATVNAALGALAEGGVVHVANGTYTECVMVGVAGATIAGESRDGVIVQPSATAYSLTRIDFPMGIFAANVVVSNMTLRNGVAGAFVMPAGQTRNARIENCRISGNNVGVLFPKRAAQSTYYTRISHCAVSGNWRGIHYQDSLRADNCLVADNDDAGIYAFASGGGAAYFANLTIAGNGTYGYYTGDGNGATFDNCILAGNGSYGAYDNKAYNRYKFYSCCFWGNGTDATNANVKTTENCVFADPLLDATESRRGHLGSGSPCSQRGTVYTGRPFEVADDLDYAERLEGKMDIGCYVSPETVNESAGDSAHILTVIGSPNGYGSPTPAYGANPVQDGTLAIDLSAMLTTSDFDGARCVPVEDGVRAIYMGYTYTEQDAQAPLYEAGPSAESFTLPSWQTNATFTILWKAQNRVIASSGAAGCLVSVNGCAPAACVTNWIDNGATYTLAFTASENFAFGEWSGDFPEGAEYRTPATTATSDRPRSISVTTVPILHVSAANGSDATGNGTRASPYATISHAISQASAGSSIYVQGGTYEEAVANNSLDSLSLVGGFDAGWTRDLRSSPSTVKSPSRGTACITLGTVRFNTVRGFVLTGGSYGIYMTGPSFVASDDRNANVNNFEQLIVTNNVTGICKEGAFCGFRIVSCLVAENANDGIRWNSDNRARGFIHNCTVVRNGRSGVALNYGYSMFDVRNTVSAFNGTYGFDFCRGAEDTRSGMNYNYIGGICAYGNALADVRQAPDLFCSLDSGTARRTARLCLRQRVFLQNPLLDDDGTPLAGSPCIGTGDNLTAYPLHGEFEDLYGTAWNGAYDIGCVKGGAAPVRTATDVYVAPDGDDANSGLSAAAPMASIQKALAKLADGGTCHLAAGEYAQDVGVYVRNATLQGAGAGKTVITGTTNPDGTPGLFNVFAAADGVILRGITSAGGYAGFTLGHSQFAKGMTLDGCEATGNTNGLYAAGMTIARSGITPVEVAFMPDCTDNSAPDNRITHCRFIDNGEFGMLTAAAGSDEGGAFNANIDNCLFARNGLGGIYLQDGKAMTTRLYYCTIVGNGGAGVANGVQNDNAGYVVVNSVVAGNEYGFKRAAYTVGSAEYSLVSGNTVADFDSSMWTADQTACSGDDAALDARTSVRHYAHLTAASPAIGLARALTSSDAINDPVDDLDHRARKPEKHRDAGCFAYGLQEGTKLILR